jgi:broad specificity phosphatase PhoE
VLLVRHALSAWNVEGRWQGHADPPLAPGGEAQAAEAAAGPFDLVVTSDLLRARRTGELLAGGSPAVVEPLLREFDVGLWSGLTRNEIERTWPEQLAAFDAGRLDGPPGGERRSEFEARVGRAARAVAGMASGRTLVVTHGGVIRAMSRLQGWPEGHISHLCGYEAEVKGGTLLLVSPTDLRAPSGGGGGAAGAIAS